MKNVNQFKRIFLTKFIKDNYMNQYCHYETVDILINIINMKKKT